MTETVGFTELLAGHVAGAALERMVRYGELLERWGRRHNLVRWQDRGELVERHLLEALAGRPLVPAGSRLVDVGSGAGLPGVPLLATVESSHGLLLEPRQKRWAFLRLVVRELGLDAEVVCCRYQELAPHDGEFDVVTARALGGTHELLGWARRRLTASGRVLLWTTDAEELDLRQLPGWRVLSSPLAHLEHGRLVHLEPCFT